MQWWQSLLRLMMVRLGSNQQANTEQLPQAYGSRMVHHTSARWGGRRRWCQVRRPMVSTHDNAAEQHLTGSPPQWVMQQAWNELQSCQGMTQAQQQTDPKSRRLGRCLHAALGTR